MTNRFDTLISLFKRVTRIGQQQGMDVDAVRQVFLVNLLSLTSLGVLLIYACMDLAVGTFQIAALDAVAALGMLVPLLLNRFRQPRLAAFFLLVYCNLLVAVYSSIYGRSANIHLNLIPMVGFALLLMGTRRGWLQVSVVCALSLLTFLGLHFSDFSLLQGFFPNRPQMSEIRPLINVSTAFLVNFGNIFYLAFAYERSEAALKSKVGQLSDAQSVARLGSWEWDFSHSGKRILGRWSAETFRIFGLDPRGKVPDLSQWLHLVHPEDRERVKRDAEISWVKRVQFDSEFRVIRPDGAVRIIHAYSRSLIDDQGQVKRIQGVCQDVTEAREAERLISLQQMKIAASSRLSALGEMAAGIAHEVNNPLAIILGKTEQVKALLEGPEPDIHEAVRALSKIETTSLRISKIIKSLRSIAREGENDPLQAASLENIVDETLEICKERFRARGVELRVSPCEEQIEIRCRPVQISQVLLNLLNNAFDATESLPEKWIQLSWRRSGNTIEIAVTDSGKGIPESLQREIMAPFFTTKEVGRGTGLGLSVSKGIVEAHQGELFLDSASPNTRFVIRLPISLT